MALPDLKISLFPANDLVSLERMWRSLEDRGEASFYLSWPWIGTWLDALPAERRPEIMNASLDGEVVGLCALAQHPTRRYGVLASHGLYLTETGDPKFDCLTVEHNDILADRRYASQVSREMVCHLVKELGGWDEFYLSGIRGNDSGDDLAALAAAAGLSIHLIARQDCRYVDLDKIRSDGGQYIDQLSKNTRYQIKRSRRLYEERGEISLTLARDSEQALQYLDELKDLHQAYWTSRGHPGAFASPFFEKFHRELIARHMQDGTVQLVRLAAGDATIGILYNFVWRGHVYSYQSGFKYEDDNRIKPGLVSHWLAIEHYLKIQARCYDFLAGDSQYKSSLGTDSVSLAWMTARRSRLKYAIEDGLRAIKHSFSR